MGKDIKLKDLIPDNKNFNVGSEHGNSLIEKSFRKFGAGRSILIDKNNRIIAGNKSFENAGAIGIEDVQIVESDGKRIIAVKRTDIDLDSPEGREMALADNATAKANIIFDTEVIEAELGEAVCEEWGIEFLEKIEEEEGEDNIPETEKISIEGDLWELNNHRLLCGSSCNIDDIDKLMNGQKADLIFTDPPYEMEDFSWVSLLPVKVSQIIIMCSDKQISNIVKNIEHELKRLYVLDTGIASPTNNDVYVNHIAMLRFQTKDAPKFNNIHDGGRSINKILYRKNLKENDLHPHAKPVSLYEQFILYWSKANGLCVDVFGGSGTCLIASEKNNRNCYLMEFDPNNVDIIVKRWVEYMQKNNKLFEIKLNGTDCKNKFV